MRGIKRIFSRRPKSMMDLGHSAYRIFIPWFDRVVEAGNLDAALGPMPDSARAELDACRATFVEASRARPEIEPVVRDPGVALTLLLDQSGSMRGSPMSTAAAAIAHAVRFLTARSVSVEVLGFTTTSWRGGRPRRLWKCLSKPANPGRLCELLHVIYRHGDESSAEMSDGVIRGMLRPDLPKENVDGEAILWAADRLLARHEPRKVLVVVSDGSPVEDSSQQANGPLFLDRHLRDVVEGIVADGRIELAAFGIGHDVSGWYPTSTTITSDEDIGGRLTDFLKVLMRGGRV